MGKKKEDKSSVSDTRGVEIQIQLYKHCPGCFTNKSEDHPKKKSDL